ncbi:MAG TPA: sensor domain-containing diguanylate cyclase [Candidatus Limnocylindria bacterium]|nr:sensor domain-containing diguanylate cyclase [Candidatus Limnocylindria bacterium]
MATRPADRPSGFDRRTRLASELATWGTAAILVASAALPTTDPVSRGGLLLTAGLLALFAATWFHLLPERIFGRMRFVIGTAIAQIIAGILLELTGVIDSPYFVFYFFPTLATSFAMRVSGTVVTGTIAIVTFLAIILGDVVSGDASQGEIALGVIRLAGVIGIVAMTALITRTMEETRATLRQRTQDLAAQNVELGVARSVGLALARARDRGEIMRAVLDVARQSLSVDRIFFFTGGETMSIGHTVGPDGIAELFEPDPTLRDSPRQRAVRTRRTVILNDVAQERGISERVRTKFGMAAALFIPLIHRGELVGLLVLSGPTPREWTPSELRIGEAIAEASAPTLATVLALEEVREQRAQLAERTKVLEGMNQLVEALALGTDETSTAEVAARSVSHAFRLVATTTLLTDPSIALLEAVGIAGGATEHPVVTGPANCPAIRSGRIFKVASGSDAVICPYMPFRDGSHGYVCAPLLAGGEPVGALFMEPAADSVLEEAFALAAADRVALAVANRRVLETAKRQATTDGLTGLHNRHFLSEQLRLLHSLAERHKQNYAVVAIDVDDLKRVNDTFGHEMGDLALRGFANVVRKTIRASDVGVRTGGDEFLVLLPRGGIADARVLAERLREAMAAQGRAEPHTAITVSLGAAAWRPGRTAEQVLEAADAMLYAAKRAGKDRIMTEASVNVADN